MPHSNRWENPEDLEVYVFPGKQGALTLFEDAGDGDGYRSGKAHFTHFTLDGSCFTVRGEGDRSVLPENRRMKLIFRGFEAFTPAGEAIETVTWDEATHSTVVTLRPWNEEEVTLDLGDAHREENRDREARAEEVLLQCRMGAKARMDTLTRIRNEQDPFTLAQSLCEMDMPKSICDALLEVLGN